jgi:hypothetical protein
MMNAQEAFAYTQKEEIRINNEKQEKVREFVNTACAEAQAREMKNYPMSYSASVDLPFTIEASAVEEELKKLGYETYIRWGMTTRLTFSWRHPH